MRLRGLLLVTVAISLMAIFPAGCGGPPAEKGPASAQEPVKPPKATSGKTEPDSLTGKEIWEIIRPYAKEAVGAGGVPVFIWGKSAPEHPVAAGKAAQWSAGFYVADKKAVWEVFHYSYETASTEKGRPQRGKNPSYRDVTISVPDWLDDWKIDSPKACATAAQNGAKEIDWVRLQVRGLEKLNKDFTVFRTPDFVPKSCKLFWVIRDKKAYEYYVDASTGSYLGRQHALVP